MFEVVQERPLLPLMVVCTVCAEMEVQTCFMYGRSVSEHEQLMFSPLVLLHKMLSRCNRKHHDLFRFM